KLYASIEQFADTKFAADPIYAEMQTVFAKYATVKEETQVIEEVETVVNVVEPKLITDDAELNAAIAELNAIIAKAGMFTEGASSNNTTGYATLHERLRVGVETALALGLIRTSSLLSTRYFFMPKSSGISSGARTGSATYP
ncbi:MAG: hypothetical protein IKH94_01920, partial [Eubacterium sp.]|nr:hypothetical protein [Eubacterium sp.]